MPIRVETDTVVTVPAIEPGSEKRVKFELTEADRPGSVRIDAHQYGAEVSFRELHEALEAAEREFAPPLRSA